MKNKSHKKPSEKNGLTKKDGLIVGLILLVGLGLRLYQITSPLTDHHSWRQVDTSAVGRNFVREGFDLLRPRYDDLSNIQSGLDNPQGYRLVEFPLYNAFFGLLSKYIPLLPLEVYGRLTTVFFSLIAIALIYILVYKEEDRLAAVFSAGMFSVFPFFVFYSRVILPEMIAVSLILVSITALYFHRPNANFSLVYIISLVSAALALLVKPTAIFYFVTLIYLFYRKYKGGLLKKINFYLYCFLIPIPFLLWRFWIRQFPEGIPFAEWLFFQTNTPQGRETIFLRPAFFRWIFDERILRLILGGYAGVFLILGILKKPKKSWFFMSMGLAGLMYLFTFQGGNVQHDYYQVLIAPVLAVFSGLGASFLLKESQNLIHRALTSVIVFLIFGFSFFISYYQIRDYYVVNTGQLAIAKIIATVTEPTARIVTDTTGDTTLLYLADRKGYPAPTKEFDQLRKDGLQYFVTMNKDAADSLKRQKFSLIFENDKVYIFRL